MPIYHSYVSGVKMPGFKRIGYHLKSSMTDSSPSLVVNIDPAEPLRAIPAKRSKFDPRNSFDSVRPMSGKFDKEASEISMTIESPPLVMYGLPKDSTGTLLSGLIHLRNQGDKEWESFTLSLQAEVLVKRPVSGGCKGCISTVNVMNKWTFISSPTTLSKDVHSFPFSYLLPGHLPASNDNALARTSYSLIGKAINVDGDELDLRRPITVGRAILPGPDRHSIRVFPPTSLSATVELPSIIHPNGDFVLNVRLDGVVSLQRMTRWRLRKVNWRIDEIVSAISPACKHHSARLGGDKKGVQHEETRTISFGEIKSGWKSDFEANGKIELDVQAGIPIQNKAACNLESSNGIRVEHVMVVEMIVAEEHQPTGVNRLVTPTGAARVLRMQFKMVVTGRSGLGISWDEEAPPVYEDVPAAPPSYIGV